MAFEDNVLYTDQTDQQILVQTKSTWHHFKLLSNIFKILRKGRLLLNNCIQEERTKYVMQQNPTSGT